MSKLYLVEIPPLMGNSDYQYFKSRSEAEAFIKGLQYAEYPMIPGKPVEISPPTEKSYKDAMFSFDLGSNDWCKFERPFTINDKLEFTWYHPVNPNHVYILFTDQSGHKSNSYRWTMRLDAWTNAGETLHTTPTRVAEYFKLQSCIPVNSPIRGEVTVRYAQN